MPGKLGIGLRRDGDAGAGGNIIEDDGLCHRVGDGGVVPDQPGLRGLVVIWRYHQQPVGPGPLRVPAEGDGVGCGVGAAAGDDRHPAVHMIHTVFDGPHPLTVGHGAGLARGTADDDGLGPAGDLEVQQTPKGIQIHGAVAEGRDDGCAGTGKNGIPHIVPPIQSGIFRVDTNCTGLLYAASSENVRKTMQNLSYPQEKADAQTGTRFVSQWSM